jgi:lysozyme
MDREKLKASLEKHEGRRNKLYVDTVGVPTIGVGFNLDKPMPDAVIDFWLEIEIDQHQKELDVALPWASKLDDVRYRVLIEMAFNLGIPRLLQFKNTLASIKRGDYDLAASQMLQSKWAMQVGKRAITLATMLRFGKDPVN